ncbi:hypothetical protein SVIOM342S_07647 [Streptomyces violaceorubidus]
MTLTTISLGLHSLAAGLWTVAAVRGWRISQAAARRARTRAPLGGYGVGSNPVAKGASR